FAFSLTAQQKKVNRLTGILANYRGNDTVKVAMLCELATAYKTIHPDTMAAIAQRALKLSEDIHYEKGSADCMSILAKAYASFNADDAKAMKYDSTALVIYSKLGDLKGMAAIYNNEGNIQHNHSEYKKAFHYFRESLHLRVEANDSAGIADCYNNIGNTYYSLGHYAEALNNQLNGLKIREAMNDRPAISNSLNNIAGVYCMIKNYKTALQYIIKAIKISEEDHDITGSINSYTNAGIINFFLKNYNAALEYNFKGLTLANQYGFKLDGRVCKIQLAETYLKMKLYANAFDYYNKALAVHTGFDNVEEDIAIYMGLGNAYIETGEVKKGIDFLLKCFSVIKHVQYNVAMVDVTAYLAKAYALNKNFGKAYFYSSLHTAYNDSFLIDENNKKIAETQFNYELAKKETAIELLQKNKAIHEKETERQKIISVGLFAFTVLMLILLMNAILHLIKERKSKKLILKQKDEIELQQYALENLNRVKDKIFSILSHDLRGPVISLSQVLSMLDDETISQEDFFMLKKDLDKQLSTLNLFLDNLLHWSRAQMDGDQSVHITNISLAALADQNFDLLKEIANQKYITLINTIPTKLIIAADFDMIDLILRNLISNALKFTNENGRIEVSAQIENNTVVIAVSDTGIGMTTEQSDALFVSVPERSRRGTKGEKGTGLGLLLCKEFINKHNGSISIKSEPGKGSTFYVRLPVNRMG
ncbi:MAG: tetratricopeptide repeat-containing sensor histidine kinase, partial [Bacteroidia bacterium]|nr:tetratricopeptide repeat-containing sensor histidine kinase [Bacteroidia bacterium]